MSKPELLVIIYLTKALLIVAMLGAPLCFMVFSEFKSIARILASRSKSTHWVLK